MGLTSMLERTGRFFEEKDEERERLEKQQAQAQKPKKQQTQALADDRPHISEEQEKWLQQKMQEAQQKEKLEKLKLIGHIKSRWNAALREVQTKSPDGEGILISQMVIHLSPIISLMVPPSRSLRASWMSLTFWMSYSERSP